MLTTLLALCGLIWMLILVYHIAQRGFVVLLIWLLIAPIVLNVIYRPWANPLFGKRQETQTTSMMQNQDARAQQKIGGERASLSDKPASIRLSDILEPTRTLFILFFVVFLLETLGKGKRALPLDSTEIWMLIFVLILMLSAVLQSRRLAFSLRIALDAFFVPFLAYYITRRLVTSEESLRKLTAVMGFLGLYLMLIIGLERLMTSELLYRVSGPFGTDNQLYVVMIAIFFMMAAETGRGRLDAGAPMALPLGLRWFLIGLVPIVIVATWARSNWLGFFAGIWVFLFLARRLIHISRKLVTLGLFLLLLPVIGIGVQAMLSQELVENRVAKTSTIYTRLAAWQLVVQAGLERPIFGIGLNNAHYVLGTQRIRYMGVKNETDAHNGFLTIFAELGVLGLFVYGAIVVSLLRLGLSLYRRGPYPRDRWRGISIIALLIAHLIPVLTTTILHVPAVCHVYIFACLGGVAGLYKGTWQKGLPPIRMNTSQGQMPRRVLSS